MLAYAADRPTIAARRSSPHSFLIIATAHILAIAVLVSIKMDLPVRIPNPPIVVRNIPLPQPSQVNPPERRPELRDSSPTMPDVVLPTPLPNPIPNPGPLAGDPGSFGASDPMPPLPPLPATTGETRGPALLTPPDSLKPPYPRAKLLLEEEASLTLKLTIDTSGRVTAVEPVGRVDRQFFEAARRHLLAHWRYRPALKDGQPIVTTLITTLHFRIDG